MLEYLNEVKMFCFLGSYLIKFVSLIMAKFWPIHLYQMLQDCGKKWCCICLV